VRAHAHARTHTHTHTTTTTQQVVLEIDGQVHVRLSPQAGGIASICCAGPTVFFTPRADEHMRFGNVTVAWTKVGHAQNATLIHPHEGDDCRLCTLHSHTATR
jgi:hypothetical protein